MQKVYFTATNTHLLCEGEVLNTSGTVGENAERHHLTEPRMPVSLRQDLPVLIDQVMTGRSDTNSCDVMFVSWVNQNWEGTSNGFRKKQMLFEFLCGNDRSWQT